MNNLYKKSLNLQKENITIDNSYDSCSIIQNQTSNSSHILGNQKLITQLTQKGQQKHVLNMREIKAPIDPWSLNISKF